MIARIRTENGFYNSIVFAVFKKGWGRGREILVFNRDYTNLQLVNMWVPKINALIYNIEKGDNWVVKKKLEGYDWIIKNITRKFSKLIIKDVDLNKCKELQATVENTDWFEIKNEADVRGLMDVSHDFFNAWVKEVYIQSKQQHICFDTTWGYEIVFKLDGNVETNLYKGFGNVRTDKELNIIYGSTIFFENGLVYWVCDESVKTSKDLDKSKYYYFCANQIKWKIIIQNGF